MTDTPYRITADPERHYLRVDQYGFWTVEIARRFVDDFARAVKEITSNPGDILLLLQQTALEVQSIEVIEILERMAMTTHPRPHKVALVGDKAMVRMQGKRISTDTSNIWFETEMEALTWLFADNAGSEPLDSKGGPT